MADLRGKNADATVPDIATWGSGNVLETGEGTVKVDLDNKASLSVFNNQEEFYEQGTWSPVIEDDSENQASFNVNGAQFIKKGREVTVYADIRQIDVSALNAGDNFRISGLPFTPETDFNTSGTVLGREMDINSPVVLAFQNGLTIRSSGTVGGWTRLTYGDVDSGALMYIQATYVIN